MPAEEEEKQLKIIQKEIDNAKAKHQIILNDIKSQEKITSVFANQKPKEITDDLE